MKKFVQYFIGFGLAFLVFAAILVSENARFDLLQKVKNPFLESQRLTKEIIITKEDSNRKIFTPEGELWIFFPESKIDFKDGNREILQGEIFLSSYFINYKNYLPDSKNGFSLKNFTLVPGWVKIGPLILNASGSNIFVIRDSVKNQSEIYAFSHSVEVFFEGLNYPFVIPSGMKATIKEKIITPKTQSLFYSKLKKDFKLEPFLLSDLKQEGDTPEEKFKMSLEQLENLKIQITNFALIEPETWFHSSQDNFVNNLVAIIQNIQNNFAIGLSPDVRDKRSFQKLIDPFVKSHIFIKNRKISLATESLEEFGKSLQNPDWKRILNRNISLENQWNNFIQAHQAWLKIITPGSNEELFVDFWFKQNSNSFFDEIVKTFSNAENLLSNNYLRKAKNEFLKLNTNLKKVSPTPEQSFQITKMRRLFIEILQKESFFQTEDMFDLYKFFIELELENHLEPEFIDEIRLESSQDLLWFLSTFLEDKTKIGISKIIIQTYKMLDTDEVVKKLGRDIFTPEESELINLITLIGNTGLTKEELDAIKLAKKYEEELDEQITELQQRKDQPDTSEEELSTQIMNAKDLKRAFDDQGIDTSSMNFKTNREEGFTEFSEGKWRKISISGIFDFTTQFFKTIQAGDSFQEQIPIRFITGFLNKISDEKITALPEEDLSENKIFISQTTPRSILERKLVQELFSLKGFSISREDIEIIDGEMNLFLIKKASLDTKHKFNFTYDRLGNSVKNITTQLDKSNVDWGSKVFELENLAETLRQEIKVLTEKKQY